ncbi:hypothetical protein FHP29_01235 [Nocardioides albidus]|uniref:PucR family transcriptional regulator n=1 Tax=Nocardioides albidus TaxID=1517589 RepID=A0A5C4WMG1_9ACTN|nr:helix-turn-helix domain-containing protein [Nocardioides albidus]TNM49508.1 hypothetical protein FHP29_01235 [Nocardioides albidus]
MGATKGRARDVASPPGSALAEIAFLSSELESQASALAAQLAEFLVEEIPELPRDADMVRQLARSVEGNLVLAAAIYRGEIGIEEITAPEDASEYARRLARRGVPATALVRAYRLGQSFHLTWAVGEIVEARPDPARALEAVRTLLRLNFHYIDAVSERVIEDFQAERDRWLGHRRTLRVEILEQILHGQPVASATAEDALGLSLRQHHMGCVLWTPDEENSTATLVELEAAASRLGEAVGASGAPLIWPKGQNYLWVWLPLGRRFEAASQARTERALAAASPRVLAGLGVPAVGMVGLRRSHEEALAAAKVAAFGGGPRRQATFYAEPGVRTAALLAGDLAGTRRLVASSLGDLAASDEPAERLRETLRILLEEGGSYGATAERLYVHKNTVKYRVAKAIALRGRPLDDGRFELELALIACHWLGPTILAEAADGTT